MGVPPNHPLLDGIFLYKPSILGIPHFKKPPYTYISTYLLFWGIHTLIGDGNIMESGGVKQQDWE